MNKRLRLSLALTVCLALGASASPDWKATLKQLRIPASRARAIEKLRDVVYELQDSRLRGEICAALLELLKASKSFTERRSLAALLESYLSHEKTPSLYFERTEPLLLDQDAEVRHVLWLEAVGSCSPSSDLTSRA